MIAQKNKIWLLFPFSVVISCNNKLLRYKKIVLMSAVLDYFNCKPTIIVIQHNRINSNSDISWSFPPQNQKFEPLHVAQGFMRRKKGS